MPIFKSATPEALEQLAEEVRVRKTKHFILLFSMGSQFDHLILQKLSALGFFALLADPSTVTAKDVKKISPAGIILSGGPASVHNEPPPFDASIFDLGIPVLGICLGFQMWAKHVGAPVTPHQKREFGVHTFTRIADDPLFDGVPSESKVLETHGDSIEQSDALINLGSTDNAPVAAGRHKHLWGVQFHPEVRDTVEGLKIYENFASKICGIKDRFPAEDVGKRKSGELKEKLAGKRLLIALSGGTDSSVVAYLLKASGAKLKGVYIRGIDRPDDETNVQTYFGDQSWLEIEIVDATDRFLEALKDIESMHEKRVAMRGVYKAVLEEKIKEFGADFIAQGTLYTDLVESGHGHATGARRARIKLHHNTALGFSVPEITPLDDQVKDTGRAIGRSLGVPDALLLRHPFPGPGLIVRIEGEVTQETLRIARAVDGIYIEELRKANLYEGVWQAGAVVTRSEHTVSKGDDAGTGRVVALWAFSSDNVFTARFAELPYDFLASVSRRITNEVREVGAVVYRISDKPPATIEWG
jgi:GMP synthase (glutamine-hydrolysing)